jgi:hypothetical protein
MVNTTVYSFGIHPKDLLKAVQDIGHNAKAGIR